MTTNDGPEGEPGGGGAGDEAARDASPRRRKKRRARAEGAAGGARAIAGEPSAAPRDGSAIGPAVASGRAAVDERAAAADERAAAVARQLLIAAGAAALGVALVGTGPSEIGRWIAIAGGVGLVASIHRMGRLGPPSPEPPAAGGA